MKTNDKYTNEEILEKIKSGEWLLSVSLGGGRDSVAMLCEFASCAICTAMKPEEIVWLAINENHKLVEALNVEDTYRATMDISEDGKSGVRYKDGKLVKVMGLFGQSGKKVDGKKFHSWREFSQDQGLLDPERLARRVRPVQLLPGRRDRLLFLRPLGSR